MRHDIAMRRGFAGFGAMVPAAATIAAASAEGLRERGAYLRSLKQVK